MGLTAAWLSEQEKDSVVEQALRVLDEVGMRFAGSTALATLAEAGCRVAAESGLVRFPPDVVREAAARAPAPSFAPAAAPPRRSTRRPACGGPAPWRTCAAPPCSTRPPRSWT